MFFLLKLTLKGPDDLFMINEKWKRSVTELQIDREIQSFDFLQRIKEIYKIFEMDVKKSKSNSKKGLTQTLFGEIWKLKR